jgi:hypothetical protein
VPGRRAAAHERRAHLRDRRRRRPPMLAHKASHEGHVAAEVIAGTTCRTTCGRCRPSPTPSPRWPGSG